MKRHSGAARSWCHCSFSKCGGRKKIKGWVMGQACCCFQVDQSTVGIEERCGKFVQVLGPGCHFVPCCIGLKVSGVLTLRVQELDIRCEAKTKVTIIFFFLSITWGVVVFSLIDVLGVRSKTRRLQS
jgi:hypothetical protein